jgi:hypothetical protein
MFIKKQTKLTNEERAFLVPKNSTHRQYEALRAFFVDNLPSQEAAHRFGYSTGSFRILCHQFRKDRDRQFFLPAAKGPHAAPKRDGVRDLVISLRKKNLSVYDIERAIEQEGNHLSAPSISIILREAGFARLPRRRDEERPATMKPDAAVIADAREFQVPSRTIRTVRRDLPVSSVPGPTSAG